MKALLGSVLILGCLASTVTGATFTVNTIGDTDDNRPYDPTGETSLRKAIRLANTTPGLDTIGFKIGTGSGLVTIHPSKPLPPHHGFGCHQRLYPEWLTAQYRPRRQQRHPDRGN
jgi:hypothetical protein